MKPIYKIFGTYLLILFFVLISNNAFGQIKVVQFNAGWNSANDVPWVQSLKDCKTIGYTDIAKNTSCP